MRAQIFQTFIFLLLLYKIERVSSIDCFKCVSMNGQNPECDDPFHNNFSSAILESPCMGGRKGRDGLFPATSCIKIAGYFDDNKETITVRGCALDSGTLTTGKAAVQFPPFYSIINPFFNHRTDIADTEIIRMSHCGKFYYDDRYVHGCLQSCGDADGCNKATSATTNIFLSAFCVVLFTYLSSLLVQS